MSRAVDKVPTSYGDLPSWLRKLSDVVNQLVDGKHNGHGSITLATSTNTTLISDLRIGADSRIFLESKSASAATERASGNLYVHTASSQSVAISHTSTATNDRTFDYLVTG